MKPLNDFAAMFGTTGVIALVLSLFFAIVALMNAWRRKRQSAIHAPKAGPILMNDPHSGTPVGTRPPPEEEAPRPAPAAPTLNPDKQATETKPPAAKNAQIFRQLDARGVDIEATRGGKNDDFQWE